MFSLERGHCGKHVEEKHRLHHHDVYYPASFGSASGSAQGQHQRNLIEGAMGVLQH